MLAPVLITAPAATPVSIDEAKAHCRVDHGDDDALITALIAAAVGHLDGWTGVLGRALVTQTWRQDYPDLSHCGLRLPLGPVASVSSVTYLDTAGASRTLAADQYTLVTDELGPIIVRANVNVLWPYTACRPVAASATFVAGTPAADVPAPIKAAILLLIGHWYANREAVVVGTISSPLPFAVDALIAPFRRVGI